LNLASMGNPNPPHGSPFADGALAVDPASAFASGRFAHVPVMIGATSADIGGPTGFMIAGARDLARTISAAGVPTYEYRFSYVASSIGQPGAQHASDIPFFFDTEGVKYGEKTTDRDRAMGRVISAYIVNFAKTGDPNGKGLPAWPRYTSEREELMNFSPDGTAIAEKDAPTGK
jgi:para-nitrobenzyl esterase